MTTYLILFVIIAVIYFVQIHNKPPRKTDWETLPFLEEYKKLEKTKNDAGELCCRHCGSTEFVERLLKSEKENPDNSKHYHACTQCKVILWRSESVVNKEKEN
jgi:hypothetical protein